MASKGASFVQNALQAIREAFHAWSYLTGLIPMGESMYFPRQTEASGEDHQVHGKVERIKKSCCPSTLQS